jgi:5-methylcytosine-specific restriction enzyme subunit McrC
MILYEWQTQNNPFEKEQLKRFNDYLISVWDSRNIYLEASDDENTYSSSEKSFVQNFFNFSFDGKISAKNYVGIVQFEGIRIEVRPKILQHRGDGKIINWKHNLFFWLSYCQRIRFPFSFADLSSFDFDDFLELLIYVFANYTENLISSQPYQSYQVLEEETMFLKGRLLFDAYTKNNLSTGKWQKFTCQHQPFVYDNNFNRIIKYVAKRLLNISIHFSNQEKLRCVLFLLDDVSDVQCTADDCNRIKLSPLFSEHQNILDLCKMYLSNQMIDTENPDSNNFCFLIPMEYVFEDFIFGFLNTHFQQLNFKSQSTAFLAKSNGSNVFQIRNDIYIPSTLIIDTKYKKRDENDGLKAGVSQTDIYQMLAYSIARNCNNVILLYPVFCNSNKAIPSFTIRSNNIRNEVSIQVWDVDIVFDNVNLAVDYIKKQLEELLYSEI